MHAKALEPSVCPRVTCWLGCTQPKRRVAIYFRDLLVLMHQIMKVTERYVDEESTHGVNTQKLLIA